MFSPVCRSLPVCGHQTHEKNTAAVLLRTAAMLRFLLFSNRVTNDCFQLLRCHFSGVAHVDLVVQAVG